MAKSMDLIRKSVGADAIKAAGNAIRLAVAVTDTDLVTGSLGILGLWGNTVERFPLANLSGVRTVCNPGMNMLQVESTGERPRSLSITYAPEAEAAFAVIIALLEARLAERQGACTR